jgi:hypothetical protein
MAKAQAGKAGKKASKALSPKGLKRLVPWGRKKTPEQVVGRTRAAVQKVGEQGRKAVDAVREKLPSGGELLDGMGKARTWAADQIGEHAMAIGVTTLAAGVAAAALLPVSDRERRAITTVTGKVQQLGSTIGASAPVSRMTRSVSSMVERVRGNGVQAAPKKAGGAAKAGAARAKKLAASSGTKAAGKPAAAARTARGGASARKKGASNRARK